MYPLSDKDLDRMSREAAEQNDVDLSPAGWERLEHKLNKELPAKKDKDRRRFLWIFFFAIALSGAGLVYLLNKPATDMVFKSKHPEAINSGNKTSSDKTSPTADTAVPSSVTSNESDNSDNITIRKENSPKNTEQPTPAPPVASIVKEEIESGDHASEKNISESQKTTANTKIKLLNSGQTEKKTNSIVKSKRKKKDSDYVTLPEIPLSTREFRKRASIDSNTKDKETVITDKKESETTTIPDSKISTSASLFSNNNSDSAATLTVNKEKLEDTKIETKGNDTIANQPAVVLEAAKSKKSSPKSPVTNRFAFGILAGTDVSNINGELKTKAGYSFGVQVSYNISKRLSVNTGFSFTKKFYKAAGADFHPPKHYFTYYVDKLLSVDGSCFMWELPVNLRYDLISTSKLKWYLNTGMSTYIMRKQDYRYDYIYNNTRASKDWSSSSQQNEWFKIVNLSSGIEYSLNKKWSIQAEPYFKLPTSGIGFGKMDISSYGLMMGLRYRPNFKK